MRGESPPWSDDPILRTYKFCNAYRASDRVSQYLIREVIYRPGFSPEDTFLRIVLFRLFSKIATWQRLEAYHGPIGARSFDPDAFAAAYAVMAAQRATKILGIFARLDRRDGKPQYLRHMPRVWRYLQRALGHPALADLSAWYKDHVPAFDRL